MTILLSRLRRLESVVLRPKNCRTCKGKPPWKVVYLGGGPYEPGAPPAEPCPGCGRQNEVQVRYIEDGRAT